jgi:hypothetical protein
MARESEKDDPNIAVEEAAPVGEAPESYQPMVDRRSFLSAVGTMTAAATVAGSVVGLPSIVGLSEAQAAEIGPLNPQQRRVKSYQIRVLAATQESQQLVPFHLTNGDEELYPNKIGSFSKGLIHKPNGEVDLGAYNSLIHALETGKPADFEAIKVGGQNNLVNPQGGLAFDLEGADSHALFLRPPPRFASAEEAGEMVELYWMALLRDVPYLHYGTNPLALAAIEDLNALSDFRGPRRNGKVTPDTLFRAPIPGALNGPYFSQFWWLPAPFGAERMDRRAFVGLPNMDYLTTFAEWLPIQNGQYPLVSGLLDPVQRYMYSGRSIAGWVHIDIVFQAYFEACLIMLLQSTNSAIPPFVGQFGLGVPFNPGNPYNTSLTQVGFVTFGAPAILALMSEVTLRALKAVWFQKWFVHRRLRPEQYGERVHKTLTGEISYPVHEDVLNSQAVQAVFDKFGTFFLPQAYPEGCPVHPSYGAGHATVAGACVTILKAMFDENFVIPNPLVATADGLALVPYNGPPLTVGGELNKHATNVAIGRNHAGVHWRTSTMNSLRLGEEVAISILRDQRLTYHEQFSGLTFTNFEGAKVTV